MSESLSETIVVSSYLLRLLFMFLAKWVRFQSLTHETEFIKNSVFYVQFFNSGILLVLATSNNFIVNGTYNDFNSYWFKDIGETIFKALVFNIFWPIIEFCIIYSISTFSRMLDQRKLIPNDPLNRTRSKTLQAYEDLY